MFGNNGTQVDPVGGNTDNHQNTLWLRSPQFTLDASGDLTAQMARGMAHGSAPANDASVSYIANGTTGWKGVALRRVSDGAFVLAKPRTSEGDAMVDRHVYHSRTGSLCGRDLHLGSDQL